MAKLSGKIVQYLKQNGLVKGVVVGTIALLFSIVFVVNMNLKDIGFTSEDNTTFSRTSNEASLEKELKVANVEQGLARYLAQIELSSDEAKEVARLINSIISEDNDAMESSLKTLAVYQNLPKEVYLDVNRLAKDLKLSGFESTTE